MKSPEVIALEKALREIVGAFWDIYEYRDNPPSNPCTNALIRAEKLITEQA